MWFLVVGFTGGWKGENCVGNQILWQEHCALHYIIDTYLYINTPKHCGDYFYYTISIFAAKHQKHHERFAAWGAVSLADSSSLMSHHGNPTPPQSQSEPEKEGLIRPYSGTTVVARHLLTSLFLVGIALRGFFL